jgi:hypothetical protein
MRELTMPLFRWWGETAVGATIRSSATLIAVTQTIHLLGLTMLIGTLLMVNLNLVGLGFRRRPTSQIARELAPWTLAGLAAMLISGPLILSSETLKAYESSFFWMKMGLLLAAILFHFTVFRRISEATPPASGTRRWMVAFVSLGLWLGVALAGKMVGIYGDDLRQEDDPFHTQKQASARSPIWNRATR